MRTPALDCPSEQAIPLLPSAVNYVLSLCSLSFDSLFWSAFSHKSWSFLLPCSGLSPVGQHSLVQCQKLVKVFQLQPYQCWTRWKHSWCFPSTSMMIVGPCSCSDPLQASHPLKNCCCSPSCVLQLVIRSTISCTGFYWVSPCFLQDISPIHHNWVKTQDIHNNTSHILEIHFIKWNGCSTSGTSETQ